MRNDCREGLLADGGVSEVDWCPHRAVFECAKREISMDGLMIAAQRGIRADPLGNITKRRHRGVHLEGCEMLGIGCALKERHTVMWIEVMELRIIHRHLRQYSFCGRSSTSFAAKEKSYRQSEWH